MATEQEKSDLAAMQEQIIKKKVGCFDYMESLSRMDAEMLRCSGHKTLEGALLYAFQSTQKEIKKLIDAHLRKYPD